MNARRINVGDKVRQASYPSGTPRGEVLTVTKLCDKGQFGEEVFECGEIRLSTLCAIKVESR